MKKTLLLVIILALFSGRSSAKSIKTWEEMNASKKETVNWFNDAKYGMFIHWGLYSIPGGIWKGQKMEELGRPNVAEWIQYVAKIPRAEYAGLASHFNPVNFDADAIVKLAKDAGMKYIVITSKHHDGFALYHSKVSKYNVVDATPFKRDIVKELYDACKKQGIDFGLYYSHNIDWMDGGDCQYSVFKEKNDKAGKKTQIFGPNLWDPSPNTFDEYLENKAYPQVREILTEFPGLTTLWYDMARYITPEQSFRFYELAYQLQPKVLINERVGNGYGDFDIPGDNKIPQNPKAITKPWQTVGTTNNSWGYKSYDNDWKSVKELLFWLVEIVSKGGNYMLNIGPTATGDIPAESVKNLTEVGKWLKINGEAIYNTRKWEITHEGPSNIKMNGTEARQKKGSGMALTTDDFWFTCKDNIVFAIALERGSKSILIKCLPTEKKVNSIQILGLGRVKSWTQNVNGLHVELPAQLPGEYGYALKIELEK